MTSPTPTITTIEPSKSKTWVTVVGGAVSVIVPLVLALSTGLDPKWQAAITAVVWVLTAAGVYKAPYKPDGTTVVPTSELEKVATPLPPTAATTSHLQGGTGGLQGPWD